MNIYIVTRHVTESKWGTAIPNLGVHTSKRDANTHFEGVLQDRIRCGAKVIWEHHFPHQHDNIIREALILHGDEHEHLKIERWIPNQEKKGK